MVSLFPDIALLEVNSPEVDFLEALLKSAVSPFA